LSTGEGIILSSGCHEELIILAYKRMNHPIPLTWHFYRKPNFEKYRKIGLKDTSESLKP